MKRSALVLGLVAALALLASPAGAQEDASVEDLSEVEELSEDQLAAIKAYAETHNGPIRGTASGGGGDASTMGIARASHYRGTWMMWTRDNVDFAFNGTVTSSSGWQERGSVWPYFTSNDGITLYYSVPTTRRYRTQHTVGEHIPTPWGSVELYSWQYSNDVWIYGNGSWLVWEN